MACQPEILLGILALLSNPENYLSYTTFYCNTSKLIRVISE